MSLGWQLSFFSLLNSLALPWNDRNRSFLHKWKISQLHPSCCSHRAVVSSVSFLCLLCLNTNLQTLSFHVPGVWLLEGFQSCFPNTHSYTLVIILIYFLFQFINKLTVHNVAAWWWMGIGLGCVECCRVYCWMLSFSNFSVVISICVKVEVKVYLTYF